MTHALEQVYSIQILRAVAASTVAWLHTWTAPLFGLFGVDLFFVISGFVMCMVVDHGRGGPVAFLVDRLTRIVPLYWAVTTMVVLVAWRLPSVMGSTVADLVNYVQSLLFIPHFRDDGQLFPVLMVGWSLNFEMLFYVLIGLVLAFGTSHFAGLMTVALVSLYAIGALFDKQTVGHEFLHNTLWFEFVLGMACFHVYRHPVLAQIPKPLALVLAGACYLAMVGCENMADRIWVAGVPSFFMLLFALQLEVPIRRAGSLMLRFIVHVGDSSYATYLSHMFVIGFLERVVYVRLGIAENYATSLFSLACCLAAGSLIYRLVDRPFVRSARWMVKRFRASGALSAGPGAVRGPMVRGALKRQNPASLGHRVKPLEEGEMSTFVATDPAAYEAYVGRGSQRLAPVFVRFAGVSDHEKVLDIGCGTGHLTRAISAAHARATGIDLSSPYVEFARRITAPEEVTFDVGDALDLPYQDGEFDRALSMLALDVLPDPAQGLREMRRVTRKAGTVAVVVNNFRCGWTPFSLVWDAAAVLDADGAAMRDEMVCKPLGWPGGLAGLFDEAGFADVVQEQIGAVFDYQSFEDYWSTFLTGQGKTGSYVTQLQTPKRDELRRHVRAAYLSGMSDGPRSFTTSFWAARGMIST